MLGLRSWKTTLAGLAAVLAVVVKVINAGFTVTGDDVAAFVAGIGLILAKDFDASHTKPVV